MIRLEKINHSAVPGILQYYKNEAALQAYAVTVSLVIVAAYCSQTPLWRPIFADRARRPVGPAVKGDAASRQPDVCFAPDNRHQWSLDQCPFCARSRHRTFGLKRKRPPQLAAFRLMLRPGRINQ